MSAALTVVGSKGRVVIPASLRKKLGIKAGTRLAIHRDGNQLILYPVNDALIRKLRGSCKGKDSIAAAREREHRREDRIGSQKLSASFR